MKYTNYILKADIIDINQLVSDKPGLKQITILTSIVVAIVGVIILGGMIPATLLADGYRSLKMQYYIYMKKYKLYNYYSDVLSSLSLSSSVETKLKMIFVKGREDFLLNSSSPMYTIQKSHIPFKLKLQYMLSKNMYGLTYQQIELTNFVGAGFNRGYNIVRKTFDHFNV